MVSCFHVISFLKYDLRFKIKLGCHSIAGGISVICPERNLIYISCKSLKSITSSPLNISPLKTNPTNSPPSLTNS